MGLHNRLRTGAHVRSLRDPILLTMVSPLGIVHPTRRDTVRPPAHATPSLPGECRQELRPFTPGYPTGTNESRTSVYRTEQDSVQVPTEIETRTRMWFRR